MSTCGKQKYKQKELWQQVSQPASKRASIGLYSVMCGCEIGLFRFNAFFLHTHTRTHTGTNMFTRIHTACHLDGYIATYTAEYMAWWCNATAIPILSRSTHARVIQYSIYLLVYWWSNRKDVRTLCVSCGLGRSYANIHNERRGVLRDPIRITSQGTATIENNVR